MVPDTMLKTIRQILTINNLLCFVLLISLCGCSFNKQVEVSSQNVEQVQNTQPEKQFEQVFEKSEIPQDIKEKMLNVTISDKSHVTFDDLEYLTLTYYGYDDQSHIGNMVVDKQISDEVISIFKELYEVKFPIEKMLLPCEYSGIDELSMRDNNTSAFNDRPIEGSGALSYHQLGRAIDINPLVNPYIRFSDGEVLPTTAHEYLDRTKQVKGMIYEDDPCVKIFKKYGWVWGGDWNSVKDYQHFEKHQSK